MKTLGAGVPFLIVYYRSDNVGGWQRLDRPLRTITTVDRFGLVRMDIKGTDIENAAGPGPEKSDGIWQRIHYAARGQTG